MKIVNIDINKIKAYENNPRRISEQAVDAVAESIKNFGFKVPCVISADNVIITGHTRVKAAEKLGLKEVPCIVADDLTPEQIKAFRLVDNKTSELTGWDFEKLDLEFEELPDFDMSDFGFEIKDNDIDVSQFFTRAENIVNNASNSVSSPSSSSSSAPTSVSLTSDSENFIICPECGARVKI